MMGILIMLSILIFSSNWISFYFFMNLFVLIYLYFLFNFPLFNFCFISMNLGVDNLSYWLILLTLWLGVLMIMASEKIYKLMNFSNLFIFMISILVLFLVLTFSSLSMMMFYIFFESSLIPVVLIIMGWGYQPERIQAMLYLFFYTMVASLPMILFLLYIHNFHFSLNFLNNFEIDSLILFMLMSMVFFVKFPMFFVHLWLPKAHVEAPVSGSMILAGIMLKLGGYGLIRFLSLFIKIGLKVGGLIVNFSLLGAIVLSILCLRQGDMKSLIAYSSVVHMSLVLGGILTMKTWGIYGALILMLGHGACSSGLFGLVNLNYERILSRSVYLNKGLINLLPLLTFWWFMFLIGNMAAPPTLNLLGEISLINSLVSLFTYFMILIFFISFFSAAYSLYLFSFSQHGKIYLGMYSYLVISVRENLFLILHWLPLNMLFLKSDLFF